MELAREESVSPLRLLSNWGSLEENHYLQLPCNLWPGDNYTTPRSVQFQSEIVMNLGAIVKRDKVRSPIPFSYAREI